MLDLFAVMQFARSYHAGQVRKYTGAPYTDHLAEVAGVVATVDSSPLTLAVAWLHDTLEDTEATYDDLRDGFGWPVADGVRWLSDLEQGNRAARKAASRARLAQAPDWVQTIKCADLISNTSSIVHHDLDFARVYLAEKRALLNVMTKADPRLLGIARAISARVNSEPT
jgi:(p)ppGpp synthase/HD superfamily hydrolase